MPSGELSPEGLEHAKQRGREFGEQAEALKGYASNHPSRRAVDTADIISDESGIKSPLTGEEYKTREITDFHYDILNPDLKHFLVEGKDIVDEATPFRRKKSSPSIVAPSARKADGQKFLPPDFLSFCSPTGNPQRFFRTAARLKEKKK